MKNCTEEMSSLSVQATVQAIETEYFEAIWCMMALGCEATGETSTPLSRADICQTQKDDPHIGPVLDCKRSDQRPVGQETRARANDYSESGRNSAWMEM